MTLRLSTLGVANQAVITEIPKLIEDRVASRIFAKDFTLWGVKAESEAKIRLGWTDCAAESLKLLPRLESLKQNLESAGVNTIVLCGMGGSSLAPEVMAANSKAALVVLDSTDPSQVSDALALDLNKVAVVVSSKSGSTVETDSQRRSFEQAFAAAGIAARDRIIVVTDPGSELERTGTESGYQVFHADPNVGGRYSALTAFGVVPSYLAGCAVETVLQDAIAATPILSEDSASNPALQLGAVMARSISTEGFRDKLLIDCSGGPIGFADWLEQLIAESTGKEGRGVLPVPIDRDSREETFKLQDAVSIAVGSADLDVTIDGQIGELFLLWEVATVVCARLLEINPFDQPDVESAKIAARKLLDSPAQAANYQKIASGVNVSASFTLSKTSSVAEAVEQLLADFPEDGYLAVQVYGNRHTLARFFELRKLFARKLRRPVTFGWGPRFLHSTGQYHKGGPQQGVFLQLCCDDDFDLAIPGRTFSYRQLITSQAEGDARVLAESGARLLTVRYQDIVAGLAELRDVLS